MNHFESISQIDYGELERQIVEGIEACIQDIQRDQELTEPRQVSATIKITPGEDGSLTITYDVTAKLAKRKGQVEGYVDREGRLVLGEREMQARLPWENKATLEAS